MKTIGVFLHQWDLREPFVLTDTFSWKIAAVCKEASSWVLPSKPGDPT